MKKSSAFSLIELSIVILIIGIIIAGVTQSSSLLAKAKLQSAQVATKSSPVAGISGLAAWFEPTLDESFLSSESEEGSIVTQWNDINPQSSSKYFLIHPDPDNTINTIYRATSGAGGLPSLDFSIDGPALLLSKASDSSGCCTGFTINPEAITMFIVYLAPDSNNTGYLTMYNQRFANGYTNNSEYSIIVDRYVYFNNSIVDQEFSSYIAAPNAAVPEIASVTSNGYDINLHINGTSFIYGNPAQRISSADYSNSFFLLSAALSKISEIIIFDRPLKKEERQSIEDYLGKKYSINIVHTDAP
jgi:prepilin-type N-terminal cleavage/methylation domain-containing protein